jgi:hypothetical protein
MPERFPVVHAQCRRALLRRFPYGIYFAPTPNSSASSPACTRAAIRAGGRSVWGVTANRAFEQPRRSSAHGRGVNARCSTPER